MLYFQLILIHFQLALLKERRMSIKGNMNKKEQNIRLYEKKMRLSPPLKISLISRYILLDGGSGLIKECEN